MKHDQKKKAKQDISLLLYFGISLAAFAAGAIFFGYFAIKEGDAWIYILSAACLICFFLLLFYQKIFVNKDAVIAEKGITIGKKEYTWADIDKAWAETIWTGRAEPHPYINFLLKDAARKKKKPKGARFDFRVIVNEENLNLLRQYMPDDMRKDAFATTNLFQD